MHLRGHFSGGKNRAHLAGVGLAAVEKKSRQTGGDAWDRVLLRAARPTMLRGAANNVALTRFRNSRTK
jgi:hypothetical protein